MENNYREERFDSFLNKTIIMSSRTYFKKQMNIANKENTILDNEDYFAFLQGAIDSNCSFSDIDKIENNLQLNSALNCLSDIEQAVIFCYLKKNSHKMKQEKYLKFVQNQLVE